MSEVAETAAPNASETAAPAEAPVSGETVAPVEQQPKTFTQLEVDAIVGKRLAKEERKWQKQREQAIAETAAKVAQPAQPVQPAVKPGKPVPENFKTTEDYIEAVAEWKAGEIVDQKLSKAQKDHQERSARVEQEQAATTFKQREAVVREKYEDFEEVAYDPSLPITEAMAQTIQASELGGEMIYHLGKNRKEAARIAALPPFLQAKELGRLEGKLAAEPPAKQTSSAPEPISPVAKPNGSQPVFDTTDPRSIKQMTTSEWIAAERERQRKRMESQGRR